MNKIQSYFDTYEIFFQIRNRYNLHSYGDWIGLVIDNYKFLNLSQQYTSTDRWKKMVRVVISQSSTDINSFLKEIKIKIASNFDPHNQISGFSQINTIFNWPNAKEQNNYIQLTDSFRITESLLGQSNINLICCGTTLRDIAVCFIPINNEIETFLADYKLNLSDLKCFDLVYTIQFLKTFIKRNQSTKIMKLIKNLYIKPIELKSSTDSSCMNHLKTNFSGAPFEIVNIFHDNTIQLTSDGIFINQPTIKVTDKDTKEVSKIIDIKEESEYLIGNHYIMWIEDISINSNIAIACYVNDK